MRGKPRTLEDRLRRYPNPASYLKEIRPRADKSHGYLYFCDAWHPLATKAGKVYHHRHVASVKAGRWLTKNELAHHADHIREHNHSGNLEIKSRRQHALDHAVEAGMTLRQEVACAHCGRLFWQERRDIECCSISCAGHRRHAIQWPSDEVFALELLNTPASEIAKRLGVSATAIVKRCKQRNIATRPRGYWADKRPRKAPRKKSLQERRATAKHGTVSMYATHGCRCDICADWKHRENQKRHERSWGKYKPKQSARPIG